MSFEHGGICSPLLPRQKEKIAKLSLFQQFFYFCPLRHAFFSLNAPIKKKKKKKKKKRKEKNAGSATACETLRQDTDDTFERVKNNF